MTEFCDDVSLDSDWKFVEPQSSSFSKKRSFACVEKQEEMRYEGSSVKGPPPSRRRMMPPTPQQSSYPSIEEMQWQTATEVQESSWSSRERTVIARMEKYLNKSDCSKLGIEELELLFGPEDSEVNLRYILRNASRRGQQDFRDLQHVREKWALSCKQSAMG